MSCKTCGKSYDACQYPLSHAHPSINEVKLPGKIARVLGHHRYRHGDYRSKLTLHDRSVLNSVNLFPFDFPQYVDEVF
jgi:hypothetical protein